METTGTGTPPGSYTSPQDAFEQMLAAEEGENEPQEAQAEGEGEDKISVPIGSAALTSNRKENK
jgi:hypothetical protein